MEKEILDGEILDVWEEGEFVTLQFGLSSVAFDKEDWEILKKDIKNLAEKI